MSTEIEVVSSFTDEEMCVHGVGALKRAGIERFRVFAPIPCEHLLHAIGRGKSPVRAWVLCGGILGVLTGFTLTAGTSLEWGLNAGGKPIISMPPFIIIMFELMILFGGILAVLGFLFNSGMPSFEPIPGYSERFGADRFGIAVECTEADGARVESILREAGAEEVVRDESAGQTLVNH